MQPSCTCEDKQLEDFVRYIYHGGDEPWVADNAPGTLWRNNAHDWLHRQTTPRKIFVLAIDVGNLEASVHPKELDDAAVALTIADSPDKIDGQVWYFGQKVLYDIFSIGNLGSEQAEEGTVY